MITVSQAIDELHACRLVNVGHACGYLQDALESVAVLRLYQTLFPDDYARSEASSQLPDADYNSEREREFLRLVNQRCFPVDEDLLEAWGEERCQWIPFWPTGPEWMGDADLADAPLAIRTFCAMMCNDELDNETLERIGPRTPQLKVVDHRRQTLDWKRFRRFCREAGGMLKHVPTAISVVTNDTGNLWIDVTSEAVDAVGPFEWNLETIQALSDEWRAAEKLTARMNRVLDWLEQDPWPLARIIRLWNRSIVKRRKKKHG